MSPDQAVFESHLKLPRFVLGVERGQWMLEKISWPFAWFSIPATRPDGSVDRFIFRFELSNYPQAAPAGCLFQEDFSSPLPPAKWPAGQLISAVFNPGWKANALYLPCDRVAMEGHDVWRTQHPELWWTPNKTIVDYLGELFELLNRRDYQGPITK